MNNCETCVYRCDQINTEKENELLKEQVKQIREQLIQELREYCSKGFECGYGEVISCQDLLAKLDLLEGGNK